MKKGCWYTASLIITNDINNANSIGKKTAELRGR